VGALSPPQPQPSSAAAIPAVLPPQQQRGQMAQEPLTAVLPPRSAGADESSSVAILLLNLGGPDSLDAVEPFLYNLFSDPEIITLPKPISWLTRPIAFCIAKYRAPASRVGYASIGGASPLLATTRDQAKALEHALSAKGVPAKAYVAMRYWYPFTEDAVKDMLAAGHRELVILPLYPQFSVSTSGSSLRVLEEIFYANPQFARVQSIVIPAW
jgi:ferrochelatase